MHNFPFHLRISIFVLTKACLNSETLHSKGIQKNFQKNFGHMSSRPAPPRPAGPTLFHLARSSREWDTLRAHGARDKAWRTERAGCRPPGPRYAAGFPPPPMSRHHRKERYNLKVYEVEHQHGSLSAVERPTGLGLALLYKTQRWRHFSMQQKLRFACLSPSSSISPPFLKSLCLIKLL